MFLALAAALTFYSGQPQLQDPPFTAETWAQYQTDTAPFRDDKTFVPIREKPSGLTADARFSPNLVLGGINRSWIVDRQHGRLVLYADWAGTGDLRNVAPVPFHCSNGICRIDRNGNRFVAVEKGRNIYAGVGSNATRFGTIDLLNHRIPFTLSNDGSGYDAPSEQSLVLTEAGEKKQYSVSERHLNLFGKSYGFKVAHDGSTLTLTPLAVAFPDRPTLLPGSLAPDFSVADIDGHVQSLGKYRGRTVLLDFWATWCHPCHRDAPHLTAFAAKHPELAIVSIAPDSPKLIRAFTMQNGIAWPQVRDDDPTGVLHRTFRVNGLPTYFLIGPDSRILTTWSGSNMNNGKYELDEQLAAHLPKP